MFYTPWAQLYFYTAFSYCDWRRKSLNLCSIKKRDQTNVKLMINNVFLTFLESKDIGFVICFNPFLINHYDDNFGIVIILFYKLDWSLNFQNLIWLLNTITYKELKINKLKFFLCWWKYDIFQYFYNNVSKQFYVCFYMDKSIPFISVSLLVLYLFLHGKPSQTGFFCDDPSLSYPSKESSVSTYILLAAGFAVSFLLVCMFLF